MARVECITIAGMDVFFNSNDHGPPHFHVRKPDRWEVRIYFRSCTSKKLSYSVKFALRSKGPTGRERTAILNAVRDNLAALTMEWEQKVQTGNDQ